MENSPDIPPATSGPLVKGVPAQVVDTDHPCISCGYNLRSLLVESKCPECGVDVRLSFLSDRLVYSNFAWLKKLHLGTALILTGMPLLVLTVIIFRVIFIRISATSDWLQIALLNLPAMIFPIGMTMLSTAEPSRREFTLDPLSRRVARITALLWMCLTVLNIGMAFTGIPYAMGQNASWLLSVLGISSVLQRAFMLVAILATTRYVRHIAARSASPGLDKLAGFTFWAFLFETAITVFMVLLDRFTGANSPGSPPEPLLMVAGCMLAVCSFFALVVTILLLLALSKDKRSAINSRPVLKADEVPREPL